MKDQYDALTVLRSLQGAKTKRQMQKVMCVWLKIALDLPAEQIAVATGLSPASVRRIQRTAKKDIAYLLNEKKGGRRREHISLAREKQILSKFLVKAQRGQTLDVQQIRRAYELSVGKAVATSTIYRLIARHGLRRFLPKARSGAGSHSKFAAKKTS